MSVTETPKEQNPKVRFLISIAYWLVILAIIFLVLKYFVNMLMPIFLAFIFASVVRPLSVMLSRETRTVKKPDGTKVQVKRRLRMNQKLAGIISVVVLFLVIGGVLVLILTRIVDSATDFVAAVPTVYENSVAPAIERAYNELLQFSTRFDESVQEMIASAIPNVITSLGSAVTGISAKLLAWLTSFASRLPKFLLNLVICLIATVFIAVDFDRIRSFIRRNLPEKTLRFSQNVKDSFLEMIWQFIKSYFIIFCITVAEITVGLLIIGVSHPVMIAALIGIFDAFPIVGSGMILLPWSLITIFSGRTIRGIGLAIVYVVVVVARQIIEPKIVGKHVGLRPIVTLTCMYAGTRIFGGVIGLFGLPIMAAILVDLNDSGIIHIFKRPEPAGSSTTAAESGEENEL